MITERLAACSVWMRGAHTGPAHKVGYTLYSVYMYSAWEAIVGNVLCKATLRLERMVRKALESYPLNGGYSSNGIFVGTRPSSPRQGTYSFERKTAVRFLRCLANAIETVLLRVQLSEYT